MARIFYHIATGNIYGVHPGAFSGSLPDVTDFIDVAEAPDQIPWPVNASGKSGEEFARVQGGVLVAFDPNFNAIDQATVDRLLLDSGVMRALAKALFIVVNDVRTLKGEGTITAAQFKTFLKGLIR